MLLIIILKRCRERISSTFWNDYDAIHIPILAGIISATRSRRWEIQSRLPESGARRRRRSPRQTVRESLDAKSSGSCADFFHYAFNLLFYGVILGLGWGWLGWLEEEEEEEAPVSSEFKEGIEGGGEGENEEMKDPHHRCGLPHPPCQYHLPPQLLYPTRIRSMVWSIN